jgi:CRP/FNR family cyclic AMP-dependent transcriptional regulator
MPVITAPRAERGNGTPKVRLVDTRPMRVLTADPSLGDGLDPERFAAAEERLIAASGALEPASESAEWSSPRSCSDTSLLIVQGLLMRQPAIDGRQCSELLGPGDVIRPWDGYPEGLPVAETILWRVLRPTRVAFLDRRFFGDAGAWPEVAGAVVTRAVRRAQSLAAHLTISSMTRVDQRLSLLFWHLAGRWGRVTPEGVRVELPLTHEDLAQLVGAQRPTVTSALTQLSRRDALLREGTGSWLLKPQRPNGHGRSRGASTRETDAPERGCAPLHSASDR